MKIGIDGRTIPGAADRTPQNILRETLAKLEGARGATGSDD
ncbi:hypothetical protein [Micromonospora sp. CB01531]|nr:hypothetical protein [Micromonospora sp. CB01531]